MIQLDSPWQLGSFLSFFPTWTFNIHATCATMVAMGPLGNDDVSASQATLQAAGTHHGTDRRHQELPFLGKHGIMAQLGPFPWLIPIAAIPKK